MPEKEIGKVSIYFNHANVAAVALSGNLKVGDKIYVKGHTTDFTTQVKSMQIEKKSVSSAKAGQHVGIKVPERVRPHDRVFLVA